MKWLLSENGRQCDPIFLIEAEERIMLHLPLSVGASGGGHKSVRSLGHIQNGPAEAITQQAAPPPSHSTSGSQGQQGGEMGLCCWMEGISSKRMVDLTNYLENPAMCSSRHSDHQTRGYST